MSTNDQGHRTQIIIAIIGLIGVLGGAVISNWDKLGPWLAGPPAGGTTQQPPAAVLEKKSDAPASKFDGSAGASAEMVRRSVRPRAERSTAPVDTLPDGRVRHLYSVWIDAPSNVLNMIDKVSYHYNHPQFSMPRTESVNRSNGFRDSYNGIGAVNADMDIILTLRSGEQVTLKFNMYQAIFGK